MAPIPSPSDANSAATYHSRISLILFSLSIIFMIPVFLYGILGYHVRLFLDDYCKVAQGQNMSLMDALYEEASWSPRYTSIFLRTLLAPLEHIPSQFAFITLMLIWTVLIYHLLKHIFLLLNLPAQRIPLVFLTTTCILTIVAAMDNQFAFFWFASTAHHLVAPIIGTGFVVVLLMAYRKVWRWSSLTLMVSSFSLAFLSAGASEAFAVFLFVFLISLIVVNRLCHLSVHTPAVDRVLRPGLFGLLVSLLVIASSPGNTERLNQGNTASSESNPAGVLHFLSRDITGIITDIVKFLSSPSASSSLLAALVASSIIGYLIYQQQKPSTLLKSLRSSSPTSSLPVLMLAIGVNIALIFPLYNYTSSYQVVLNRYSRSYAMILLVHGITLLGWLVVTALHRVLFRTINNRFPMFWYMLGNMAIVAGIAGLALTLPPLRLFVVLNALVVLVGCAKSMWPLVDTTTYQLFLPRSAPQTPFFRSYGKFVLMVLCVTFIFSGAFLSLTTLQANGSGLRTLYTLDALLVLATIYLGMTLGATLASGLQTLNVTHQVYFQRASFIVVLGLLLIPCSQAVKFVDLYPGYTAYSAEWDERDVYLKQQAEAGVTTITIPILQNDIKVIPEREILMGSVTLDYWNSCAAWYYGFDEVNFVPR